MHAGRNTSGNAIQNAIHAACNKVLFGCLAILCGLDCMSTSGCLPMHVGVHFHTIGLATGLAGSVNLVRFVWDKRAPCKSDRLQGKASVNRLVQDIT